MYRRALAPSVLAAGVLLTGCAGQAATHSSTSAATGTSTAAPAGPTVVDEVDEPAADPTRSSPPTPVPSQRPAPGKPGPPPEVQAAQGAQVWAVYLAVAEADDPSGEALLAETSHHVLSTFGYSGSGIGDVSCDQGAAEQLGLDPPNQRVAVYFDSAASAQQFVGAYDRRSVGSARVTTYCLD
jgi:hypothetical protein